MICTRCHTPMVPTQVSESRFSKHSEYECRLCGHTHHSFEPAWHPTDAQTTARDRSLAFSSRTFSFEILF